MKDQLLIAQKMLGAGEPEKTIQFVKNILNTVEVHDARIVELLARAIAQSQGISEAIETLDLELEKTDDREYLHSAKIQLLIDAGDYSGAIEIARHAIGLFPQHRSLMMLLSDALELSGDAEAAVMILSELTERHPHDSEMLDRYEQLKKAVIGRRIIAADASEEIERSTDTPYIPVDKDFIKCFTERFAGREGVYAIQFKTKNGTWGYRPERGILSPERMKLHIAGDITLGSYLVRRDDTASVLAFDLDVTKSYIGKYVNNALERRRIKRLMIDAGRNLITIADSLNLPLLIEFSGFKGLHFWAFSNKPVSARQWRIIGGWILENLEPSCLELQWELFPKQDKVEPGGLGNLVKIPLGIHRRSGMRSYFLERTTFRPFQDQGAAFRDFETVDHDRIMTILGSITLDKVRHNSREEQSAGRITEVEPVRKPDEHPEMSPLSLEIRMPLPKSFPDAIENMLAGCNIVWKIVAGALAGRSPDPMELHVITYLLAYIGEDGRVFLHQVLSKTPNYDPNELNRAIKAVPPNPMSCVKVRKNLPQLAAEVGCECRFRIPNGCYSSPVVYAGVVPSTGKPSALGKVVASQPVALSHDEELIGASAGIDILMREFLDVRAQIESLSKREKLLRRRINKLFDNAQSDTIQTKLAEYRRLPEFPEENELTASIAENTEQCENRMETSDSKDPGEIGDG